MIVWQQANLVTQVVNSIYNSIHYINNFHRSKPKFPNVKANLLESWEAANILIV